MGERVVSLERKPLTLSANILNFVEMVKGGTILGPLEQAMIAILQGRASVVE